MGRIDGQAQISKITVFVQNFEQSLKHSVSDLGIKPNTRPSRLGRNRNKLFLAEGKD